MKLNKGKKGISLIVLVITIIVMIILATAIILTLNSNNIVGKANEAKASSDRANILEVAAVYYAEYDLKTKTGELDSAETSAEKYVKDALKDQGFSQDTLKLLMVTEEGNIFLVKIPSGFVASDISTEDEISEGLVIYEGTEKVSTDTDAMTTRNQYVWVPVPDISEFVRKDGYYNGAFQTYVSSGSATEPYSYNTSITEANDSTGEYAEYAKMRASVAKNGGFYIARYEAGTTNQRTNIGNGTSFKSDGITPDVLSQKDKYPYNYVGWGPTTTSANGDVTYNRKKQGKGAVELSRSIYPESANKDVVSTLCYGVQWDAVMNFMKDIKNPNGTKSEYYIYDSTNMGWYSNNKSNNAEYKTGKDVDTNKSNMVKNIYDMAGNMYEWTMEALYSTYRVIRGGHFNSYGTLYPASYRCNYLPHNAIDSYGFRLALYIK